MSLKNVLNDYIFALRLRITNSCVMKFVRFKSIIVILVGIFNVVVLTSCHNTATSISDTETERQLLEIDSVIVRRHHLEKQRASKISSLQRAVLAARDTAQRIDNLQALCSAYSGHRLDSALFTAYQSVDLARKFNDPERITTSTVFLAQSLINYGDAEKGISILDSLTAHPYNPDMRGLIYSAYFGAYSTLKKSAYFSDDRLKAQALANIYRDSLISVLPPRSVGHTYLTATRMQDEGHPTEALKVMEKSIENQEFTKNAAFNYGLGKMYLDAGLEDDAIHYFSRASYLDLQAGKKEYESLIKLARILYDKGDIKRAFNYIRCAFEDASFSHATIRTHEILEIMPVIEGAYRAYEAERMNRIRITAIIAIIFGVLMVVGLIVLWKQFRNISRIKSLLAEYNEELAHNNDLLKVADESKISHIESLLNLHASNIARNKTYRRNLLQMMTAGQYSRVASRLRSDSVDNAETHHFYELFDSTFMAMFPDFIKEINKYMKVPFTDVHPTMFTPEQRIMALMKFGHSAAAEVSAVLQYSQQTIYNYRSSIRAMLNCPLSDFEKSVSIRSE